jgi:hypothetical protein
VIRLEDAEAEVVSTGLDGCFAGLKGDMGMGTATNAFFMELITPWYATKGCGVGVRLEAWACNCREEGSAHY